MEIQLRSIAMDFWASLEHKIYFKYDGEVPNALLEELKEAADTANEAGLTDGASASGTTRLSQEPMTHS